MNTNKSDNESHLLIQNQHFLNESSLAEFYDTHFKNCEFLGVDLAASDFDGCKLKSTRFFKSNLNLILVEDVKVWKSKEWLEIKDFSSFEKHLDE